MGRVLRRGILLMATMVLLLAGGIVVEGRLSGWAGLAEEFAADDREGGLTVVVQSGGLGEPRWFHRVAPLQASVGIGGLRLSYPFPYSMGHPPLEIPWRELRLLDVAREGGVSEVRLSVSRPERARISLQGDLASVVGEWLGR